MSAGRLLTENCALIFLALVASIYGASTSAADAPWLSRVDGANFEDAGTHEQDDAPCVDLANEGREEGVSFVLRRLDVWRRPLRAFLARCGYSSCHRQAAMQAAGHPQRAQGGA